MSNDQLKRLPRAHHHSLKAWNAADELIIQTLDDKASSLGIYNDAFGYLACELADRSPQFVTDLRSQKEAILMNTQIMGHTIEEKQLFNLLEGFSKPINTALLKVPKSIDLFEMYINHIHQNLSPNGIVYCGFMTKYFNSSLLKIVNKYFANVSQTKARKKARLLVLSNKKELDQIEKIVSFSYDGTIVRQYRGVFSSNKIDSATDFLLKNINIPYAVESVLDMASGNGVIGQWVINHTDIKKIHFIDDSYLAIASSKLNVKSEKATFHHHYELKAFSDQSLDWIITNPPFHFGHTIDIGIPLDLFNQAAQKLRIGGTLTIVSNSNLGYETTLKSIYRSVKTTASNHQYKIYECRK